jgi:hypothetical protein
MGKKSGSAGQRGKKQHAREMQRRKAPPKRPTAAAAPRVEHSRSGWLPAEEGIEGLVRRLEIHYHEAAHHAAEHAGVSPAELPSVLVTPARVAALSTPDLLARLGAVGVTTDREAFLAATASAGSALQFAAERWLPLLGDTATVHDRDFVRLSACDLWKRFRPGAPSTEGLLDLFQRGFAHARKHEDAAAVGLWLDFWAGLRPRLPAELRTLDAVNGFFGEGFTEFDTWIEVLINATEGVASGQPDLARRVVALLEEVHQQLSAEDDEYRSLLVRDRVGLLICAGARAEGERIMRAIIAEDPSDMRPYLALASLLAPVHSDDRAELSAALALLEEAETSRRKDSVEWALDMTMTELRERLQALDADA